MADTLVYGQYISSSSRTSVASGNLQPIATDSQGNVLISTQTINAVVNTGSATDPKIYIGLTTATIGNPTLYAVVNTSAAGDSTNKIGFATVNVAAIAAGVNSIGFASVTPVSAWPDPKTYIGLVTVANTVPVTFSGNVTISDSKGYIGLTSVSGTVGLGTGTLNIGSVSVLGGTINANLNAGVNGIGFTTTYNGTAWPDPKTFIGLVSVSPVVNATGTNNIGSVSVLGGVISLQASTLNIGSVSILGGKIVNDTSTLNIGSVSVLGGGIGLNAGVNGIGFATVKVDAGTQFIGLVTAWNRNAGTTKTLANIPIALSQGSVATIAVPTNNQTMYITNLLVNSNATVRVSIKSGVTYLTGNSTIGITLNPGGGWVETGSPDSPVYIGNPSGAIVVEKLDLTSTSALVGGRVTYFQE